MANGISFYDKKLNKIFVLANFWGANLGPDVKGDSQFAIDQSGLWKVYRMKNKDPSGTLVTFRNWDILVLVDDSEFNDNILYYQVYLKKQDLTPAEVKAFYDQEQKISGNLVVNGTTKYVPEMLRRTDLNFPQINESSEAKYLESYAWVRLKYDPKTGQFSSKIVNTKEITDLAAAKTKFDEATNQQLFDGVLRKSNGTTAPNWFDNFTITTLAGPIVFVFEKDLALSKENRKWKLISKYPENYEFADKQANGKLAPKTGEQYINLQPGNGVVLKNGIYGLLFNKGASGLTDPATFKPTLVTGKYDLTKNRILWQNQGDIVNDSERKLMFSQIADASETNSQKFAYLPSFRGSSNDLLFYKSSLVNSEGIVDPSNKTTDKESDDKNSLGFPINHLSFHPGFAGFQSAQGKSWFIVAGPSKQSGVSWNQDGLILLVNSDFSRIYPIDKILGGFQNSVINIESATKTTEGWTNVKFVISYETKSGTQTNVNFKKFDLDLDLRES